MVNALATTFGKIVYSSKCCCQFNLPLQNRVRHLEKNVGCHDVKTHGLLLDSKKNVKERDIQYICLYFYCILNSREIQNLIICCYPGVFCNSHHKRSGCAETKILACKIVQILLHD